MGWYEEIEAAGDLGHDECSALAAEVVLHCLQEALSKGKSRKCVLMREMAIRDLQSRHIANLAIGAGIDPDAWREYVAKIVAQQSRGPR